MFGHAWQDGACIPLLDAAFLPLIKRTFELLPPEGPKESDENNDRIALLTSYYSFVDVCATDVPPPPVQLLRFGLTHDRCDVCNCVPAAHSHWKCGDGHGYAKYVEVYPA